MEQVSRLREIRTEEAPQIQKQPDNQASQASVQLLILALKTLSQRTLVALGALRGLVLAGSVFWAVLTILPDPNAYKLVGIGLYGLFCLVLEIITYRR